jgi:pimeloyl-ACP methyl ester carboxylesterase
LNEEVLGMPNISANGIQIEYETFGNDSCPPLLLIMGLGAQMIFWPDEFCEMLANGGHYVIRFDNRDVGLSSKFEEAGVPDIMEVMSSVLQGEKVKTPYSLDDMADDAIGLLDSLDIETAHICGLSMGGMIAQVVAYRYPSRVLSLFSIMSTTGNPELPQGTPEALAVLFSPVPEEREENIEYNVKVQQTIGSPGFPFDEDWIREVTARCYDRCFCPEGAARQTAAIIAHGNRKPSVATITVPTLVIHGSEDPLVPVEAAKDTAESIPGAELLIIDGMGHDLPREVWPQLVDVIAAHTQKVNS